MKNVYLHTLKIRIITMENFEARSTIPCVGDVVEIADPVTFDQPTITDTVRQVDLYITDGEYAGILSTDNFVPRSVL